MEIHGYNHSGGIDVTIDGIRWSVPDDMENGLRQRIAAEWGSGDDGGLPPFAHAGPTTDDIKAECRRRILHIMTEDQQRNTLAAGQAAMMEYGSDPSSWPVELQARQASAMAAWAEIERLRARSNEIEEMDNIPDDVAVDELWLSPE